MTKMLADAQFVIMYLAYHVKEKQQQSYVFCACHYYFYYYITCTHCTAPLLLHLCCYHLQLLYC
jgi:hypothetical protein